MIQISFFFRVDLTSPEVLSGLFALCYHRWGKAGVKGAHHILPWAMVWIILSPH